MTKLVPIRRLVGMFASRSAVAAVEFAIMAPVIMLMIAVAVDFGWVFNLKLRVAGAVSAAAHYAFANGGSMSAAAAPAFITKVSSVAQSQDGLGTSPTVTILVNNAADGSNADKFYCLSSSAPPTWTSTGNSQSSCGDGTQSGKFVTVTVLATTITISPWSAGETVEVQDSAIVRLP